MISLTDLSLFFEIYRHQLTEGNLITPGHTVGWEHTFVHENYEFLKNVADGSRYRLDFKDGIGV